MRVTYDPEADAAYIYLVGTIGPGGVAATHECDLSDIPRDYDLAPIPAMINLDFDASGRLLGIEVIGARQVLPEELLRTAEKLHR